MSIYVCYNYNRKFIEELMFCLRKRNNLIARKLGNRNKTECMVFTLLHFFNYVKYKISSNYADAL